MRAIEWLALLALAAVWGMSFLFMELAFPSFEPFSLVFFRVSIAAVLVAWLLRRQNMWRFLVVRWQPYALLAFFGTAFPFLCFAWGQRYVESGMASILNALTPLATLVLALMLGRERYSLNRVAGLLLGFVGVVVLVDADTTAAEWQGTIVIIIAALSYAVGNNIAWAYVSQYPPIENAFGQLVFAVLYMLPFMLYEQPWQATFYPAAVAALVMLAVFSTFIAYLLYYFLISNVGGVNTSLSVLLIPIVAVSLGIIFLDERFGSSFFVGGFLIIGGIVCADRKLYQLLYRLFLRKPRG